MKSIPLRGKIGAGKFALVDDDIYLQLSPYKWFYSPQGYVWTYYPAYSSGGKLMHRIIMGEPSGLTVDHRDRDPLNNQRSNLRTATYSEQNMNQRVRLNNTSGHRGVYWESRRKCWRVCINYRKKQVHVGQFKDKQEAIAAYKAKALELYGEFVYVPQ